MSRSLYLFVTSERPDQYLNSIVHCTLYEGVKDIVFLHIRGLEKASSQWSGAEDRGISAVVLRNVQVLLDCLAIVREYRYFVGEKSGERISLQEIYPQERVMSVQRMYKQCLDVVNWRHRDVSYLDLRKELAQIHRKEPDSIFDVTAIKKRYLGDIIAASIIEGIQKLYTFDMKASPNFDEPWTMLFHDLHADVPESRRYQYVNIVDTLVFRECSNSILVRTLPLKISLIAAVGLLLLALGIYFFYGQINWFIQITSIASAVAGLLSLYYNFFPPRQW